MPRYERRRKKKAARAAAHRAAPEAPARDYKAITDAVLRARVLDIAESLVESQDPPTARELRAAAGQLSDIASDIDAGGISASAPSPATD